MTMPTPGSNDPASAYLSGRVQGIGAPHWFEDVGAPFSGSDDVTCPLRAVSGIDGGDDPDVAVDDDDGSQLRVLNAGKYLMTIAASVTSFDPDGIDVSLLVTINDDFMASLIDSTHAANSIPSGLGVSCPVTLSVDDRIKPSFGGGGDVTYRVTNVLVTLLRLAG